MRAALAGRLRAELAVPPGAAVRCGRGNGGFGGVWREQVGLPAVGSAGFLSRLGWGGIREARVEERIPPNCQGPQKLAGKWLEAFFPYPLELPSCLCVPALNVKDLPAVGAVLRESKAFAFLRSLGQRLALLLVVLRRFW